jgi:PAS domain S-box-containing protein
MQQTNHNQWLRFILGIIFPAILAIAISIGSIYFVIIPAFQESFLEGKRNMLRELTSVAISIMDLYQREEEAGRLTRAEAQHRSIEEIERLRYGASNQDYFWINDMHPKLIMHPYSKELVGSDLSTFRSPDGSYVFLEVVKAVQKEDSAFVDYLWPGKYSTKQVVPKLSYVRKFAPWGWVVGTGVFLDDVAIRTREITDRLLGMVIFAVGLVSLLMMSVAYYSLRIERRRKAAEVELRQSEEKYRALVEAAAEPIMMLYGGRVIYANRSMEQLLKYRVDELEGMEFTALLAENLSNSPAQNLIEAICSTGGTDILKDEYEVKLLANGGRVVNTMLSLSQKIIGSQKVLVMSVHDLSVVKRVERQLGESREKFRQMTTSLNIGVFRVAADARFRFLELNSTVADLAGAGSDAELLSTGLIDLIDRSRSGIPLRTLLQDDGYIRDKACRMKSKDGESKTISLSMALVKDDMGKPLYYDGFMVDISEHKKREEQREHLIVELQTSLLFLNQPIRNGLRPFISCDLHATVRDAAAIMSRTGRNSLLVASESGRMIGIITDTILRQRVLAENMPAETRVYEVMSSPLNYIEDSALIFEALMRMQERGERHLVVRESSGTIISVVTNEELLDVHRYSSAFMLNEIRNADAVEDIQASRKRIPQLVKALSDSGAHARNITRIMTNVSDAVVSRLIELAIEELGKPPVRFAFMALGSDGREEQTLATDQDNAIIFADVEPESIERVTAYFRKLGAKVCTWLDQAGYRLCEFDVMAMNPRWCQPLTLWKSYFSDWISDSNPEELKSASIFFDFRCVYGDSWLSDELRKYIRLKVAQERLFSLHFGQAVLALKIPVDVFSNLSLASGSSYPDTFNIKNALAVIVGYARIYAVEQSLECTNTVRRIDAMFEKKDLTAQKHEKIVEAYNYLMQIRFKHQVRCLNSGEKSDNYIKLDELTNMEKEMLEKVLVQIADLQKDIS